MRAACSLRPDLSDRELHRLCAGAERRSEHPLGRAVVQGFGEEEQIPDGENFQMIPGRGVRCTVEGRRVAAGSAAFLAAEGAVPTEEDVARASEFVNEGCTVVWIAADGRPAGFIALSDMPRAEAAQTVRALKDAGVRPVLLTGDHAGAARHTARELGIEDWHAECLPEDKMALHGTNTPACA